jgi:hypothetical protein
MDEFDECAVAAMVTSSFRQHRPAVEFAARALQGKGKDFTPYQRKVLINIINGRRNLLEDKDLVRLEMEFPIIVGLELTEEEKEASGEMPDDPA